MCHRCTISSNHYEHVSWNLGSTTVDGLDAIPNRIGLISGRHGYDDLLVSHTDLTDGSRSQNRNWRHVLTKVVAVDFLASSRA